jgi:hypothetical protein
MGSCRIGPSVRDAVAAQEHLSTRRFDLETVIWPTRPMQSCAAINVPIAKQAKQEIPVTKPSSYESLAGLSVHPAQRAFVEQEVLPWSWSSFLRMKISRLWAVCLRPG